MNDLISVIIPMYNTELYVEKMLNCLKNQTYKNLQILVINDGSTDNSLKIVEKFAKEDKRIEIITTKNNGVSIARNIGIDNIKGEYVIFLDSDDYIEFDMYEKMLLKMKEKKVDVLRCNYICQDEEGNLVREGKMYDLSNKVLVKDEIKNIFIPYIFENKIETYVPLMLIKTDIIKKINAFNCDIHMMEDLLFALDLFLCVDSMYFYDENFYHYIYRPSSSSKARNRIIMNFKDTLKVVNIVEKLLEENNISEEILKKVYHIYSTMIVKYTLRTFQKDDEYKLSIEKIIELLSDEQVCKIIDEVDFSKDSIYISTAGKYIQEKKYEKLYEYGESISNIAI